MQRSKLKLTAIFLLAVLNLVLLASVVIQHQQSQHYVDSTRSQLMTYLEDHNITVAASAIPWESALITDPTDREGLARQILNPTALPAGGLPDNCEIQPAREAASVLMDLVLTLKEQGSLPLTIQSIREGYRYNGEADRAVLTPMWEVTTPDQTLLIDCTK